MKMCSDFETEQILKPNDFLKRRNRKRHLWISDNVWNPYTFIWFSDKCVQHPDKGVWISDTFVLCLNQIQKFLYGLQTPFASENQINKSLDNIQIPKNYCKYKIIQNLGDV